ncbi:MAG TPA: HlyD family type I secretion periplasmic adaptor subunit [Paracoccaceae bacterium]|nr:HlyD family type I secretion periplasmic adaptor subunit [Paracoccaceae bacterium]
MQDAIQAAWQALHPLAQGIWTRIATGATDLRSGQLTPTAVWLLMAVAGVLCLALAQRAILRRRARALPPGPVLADLTRGPRRIALMAAVLFFGVFGLWSWYTPLMSAALAPGVVSPEGSRKTVQHLEGGIIRTIHVREGDTVDAGTVLVTLDDTRALARAEELADRQVYLLAVEARLVAEITSEPAIRFPPALAAAAGDRERQAVASQTALFQNRRDTQTARERILAKRVDQLREEITGLQEVIAAQDEQIRLIAEELGVSTTLYDQGLQRLPQVLALRRTEAELTAARAANRAAIARLGQEIGETEVQLLAARQQVREEVAEELTRVRAELALVKSQLPERLDALARTQITAPMTGRVMNVQITTEQGGILAPGGSILDIVPDGAPLIIDARVRPQDIDTVRPGLRARVVLTAYSQRNLPQIFGVVRTVSADRLTDPRTGEPYFLARVQVDPAELSDLSTQVELIPGMSADVMILTGTRSFADALLQPLAASLRSAFRDG